MRAQIFLVSGAKKSAEVLSSIKKAKVKISKKRDLKKNPLSWAEIKSLAKLSGGADKIFDRTGFRVNGKATLSKDGTFLSENEMLKLMAQDHHFIRSPIILLENRKVIIGSKLKGLSQRRT